MSINNGKNNKKKIANFVYVSAYLNMRFGEEETKIKLKTSFQNRLFLNSFFTIKISKV